MIYCVNEYIWYKKKRCKASKICVTFIIVFLIILGGVLNYKYNVSKCIYKYCLDYTTVYSSLAVNNSVLKNLSDGANYSDLVKVEKNNNGDIVLMSANTYKTNVLSRKIIEETEENLNASLNTGVPIPFFAFLGIESLSGYGKKINYKSVYVSSVNCEFISKFDGVGINQTLHSIYIKVICLVDMLSFSEKRQEKFETQILISETVLIGKVPEIYLNGKLFD